MCKNYTRKILKYFKLNIYEFYKKFKSFLPSFINIYFHIIILIFCSWNLISIVHTSTLHDTELLAKPHHFPLWVNTSISGDSLSYINVELSRFSMCFTSFGWDLKQTEVISIHNLLCIKKYKSSSMQYFVVPHWNFH